MRQISKIHFTSKGEVSNYFNFLKKFEIRTVRSTKNKPAQLSGFLFIKQCSRITINTYFTRLQQAFKLKFAPLFTPITNLLKET